MNAPRAVLLEASYAIQRTFWNFPTWHEMKMAKPSESVLLEHFEKASRFSMGKTQSDHQIRDATDRS